METSCWVTAEVNRAEVRRMLASQSRGLRVLVWVEEVMKETTYDSRNPLSRKRSLKAPIPPRVASS